MGLGWTVAGEKGRLSAAGRWWPNKRADRSGSSWAWQYEWNGLERLFADAGLPPQVAGPHLAHQRAGL